MSRIGIRVLFLGVFALVAGLVGYQIGVGSSAAAAGATVIVAGGGPGFGFLFFLFFLGIVLFAFGGRRRGPWGYGHRGWAPNGAAMGGGTGTGDGSSHADPRRQWVAEMHRSLHAAEAAASGRSSSGVEPPTATPAG